MIKTFFIESTLADYTAEEFSFFQKFYLEEGVFGDTDGTLGLSVTQNSPAAMNVLVSVGNGLVEIVKNATTWKVVAMSDTQATVAIPSNSSGSNRVDAIILRVDKDTEPNALKTNIATIERVAGTGVSALSDGAIDTAVGSDGWIRLANVTVANGASSIATGDIADTRIRVKSNESIRFSPKKMEFRFTTSDPTGADLVEGLVWYNSTTHKFKYYDGTSAISMETSTYTAGSGIGISSGSISVDSTVVRTSGDQTVNGIKTLGSIPVLPASDPTTDNQAVRKAYVDGLNIGAVASDTLKQSADTERNSGSNNTTMTLVKSIRVNLFGTFRIKFDLHSDATYGGSANIYRNGVAYGTERNKNDVNYQTYSEDLMFTSTDKIELYCKASPGGTGIAYIRNFRIYYDRGAITENAVVTD